MSVHHEDDFAPDTTRHVRSRPAPPGGRRRWLGGLLVLMLVVAAFVAGMVTGRTTTPPATNAAEVAQSDPASSAVRSPATIAPSASAASSAQESPSTSVPGRAPGGPARSNLSAETNCAPHPSRCGFPDKTNTGVPPGVKLAVVNGNQEIEKPGTVIDGKDIRGCVDIKAKNVTIRRSKISCKSFFVVASWTDRYSGGGARLEDVELDCQGTRGTGVGSYGLTVVRAEIHGCENGVDVDHSVTVRDSYIHSPFNNAEAHSDGMQFNSGSKILVDHNTIVIPDGTSAIISHPNGNADVTISRNLLAGGAYTLYCPRDSSRDFRVVDNRFSKSVAAKGGAFGPWTDCPKVAEVAGNVWDGDLTPVKVE
jgi:hypothetical protein